MTAGQAFSLGLCLTALGFVALGALTVCLIVMSAYLHLSPPSALFPQGGRHLPPGPSPAVRHGPGGPSFSETARADARQ